MKIKFNFSYILILSIVFLLSSCHPQNKKSTQNLKWRDVSLWTAKGKLSIQSDKQRGSGSFEWNVNQQGLVLAKFKAPLGQGSWTLEESNDLTTLTSSKNGVKTSSSTDDLIQQEFGWKFPWNSLSNWLRGFKSNQLPKKHKTEINHLKDLQWHITFSKWQHTKLGLLPKVIKAEYKQYKIKIIIYNWSFN